MRDIRSDLQERLDAVAKDRFALQAQLTELDHIETGIKALMQREGMLFVAASNGNGSHSEAEIRTPLSQFVLQTLREAQQPMPLDKVRDEAIKAGLDFGDKSPGRVVHWALVGMAQHGSVEKLKSGWRIKED
jgi:hypothetical protein